MNTCLPMNNKTLTPMLDVSIFFEDNLYKVIGITEDFQAVTLGKFENVLEAYGMKLSYGFDGCTYEIPVSSFENRTVEFTID